MKIRRSTIISFAATGAAFGVVFLGLTRDHHAGLPLSASFLSIWTVGPLFTILASLWAFWSLFTAPAESRILDPQATLVLRQSPLVRCVSLFVTSAVVATAYCLFVEGAAPDKLFASPIWVPIFIAIAGLGLVWAVITPGFRLAISPHGIEYSRVKPTVIAWDDVAEVRLETSHDDLIVKLVLSDTKDFRSRFRLLPWRKINEVALDPQRFGIDPRVLEQGLALRRNAYASPTNH